jgi:hypothetical protein
MTCVRLLVRLKQSRDLQRTNEHSNMFKGAKAVLKQAVSAHVVAAVRGDWSREEDGWGGGMRGVGGAAPQIQIDQCAWC